MQNIKNSDDDILLIIVSDSIFLSQQDAHRTALDAMMRQIRRHTGRSQPEILDALRRRHPPVPLQSQTSLDMAQGLTALYLAERAAATRIPEDLPEALSRAKVALTASTGRPVVIVGLSSLPPEVLARHLAAGRLASVFDQVYGNGRPDRARVADEKATAGKPRDWIRGLPLTAEGATPKVLKGLCALHHVSCGRAVLVGGRLEGELAAAHIAGLHTVHADLGQADPGTSDRGSVDPTIPPEATIRRLDDLAGLAMFSRSGNPVNLNRPPRTRERD